MPEYNPAEQELMTTPPPYMDPANSHAFKLQKQRTMSRGKTEQICKHCGSRTREPIIWPAPRPAEHIRPNNFQFIGYVLLIAVVIFLLFAACKYLP